jgi:hypothetical protein
MKNQTKKIIKISLNIWFVHIDHEIWLKIKNLQSFLPNSSQNKLHVHKFCRLNIETSMTFHRWQSFEGNKTPKTSILASLQIKHDLSKTLVVDLSCCFCGWCTTSENYSFILHNPSSSYLNKFEKKCSTRNRRLRWIRWNEIESKSNKRKKNWVVSFCRRNKKSKAKHKTRMKNYFPPSRRNESDLQQWGCEIWSVHISMIYTWFLLCILIEIFIASRTIFEYGVAHHGERNLTRLWRYGLDGSEK